MARMLTYILLWPQATPQAIAGLSVLLSTRVGAGPGGWMGGRRTCAGVTLCDLGVSCQMIERWCGCRWSASRGGGPAQPGTHTDRLTDMTMQGPTGDNDRLDTAGCRNILYTVTHFLHQLMATSVLRHNPMLEVFWAGPGMLEVPWAGGTLGLRYPGRGSDA